jgi:hypothetical protein
MDVRTCSPGRIRGKRRAATSPAITLPRAARLQFRGACGGTTLASPGRTCERIMVVLLHCRERTLATKEQGFAEHRLPRNEVSGAVPAVQPNYHYRLAPPIQSWTFSWSEEWSEGGRQKKREHSSRTANVGAPRPHTGRLRERKKHSVTTRAKRVLTRAKKQSGLRERSTAPRQTSRAYSGDPNNGGHSSANFRQRST